MSAMAAAVEASPLMQVGLWLIGVGFSVGCGAFAVLVVANYLSAERKGKR